MNQSLLGSTLVSLQFGLLAVLTVLSGRQATLNQVTIAAWVALTLSLATGLWALASNRLGNFNIRPTPRVGGNLIQHGPYRWVRHPMYTAVLLFGAACAMTPGTARAWMLWSLLAVVLTIKAMLEERWMAVAHPSYLAYQTRTKRYLPFIL